MSGRKSRSRSSVRTTLIVDKEEQKTPIEKLSVFENLVRGITPENGSDRSDNNCISRGKAEECMVDQESKRTKNMACFQQESYESSAGHQIMRKWPKNLCQTKIAVKNTLQEKDGEVQRRCPLALNRTANSGSIRMASRQDQRHWGVDKLAKRKAPVNTQINEFIERHSHDV